ncbi:MAG: chorismate synthase [Gemmatimonas sp.]|nr:chorismate synthase [Gemmatimonas sp.]
MFRFSTAGESHGPVLISLIEGVPAGLPVVAEQIDRELRRRQGGYGRGGRMRIESDRADIRSGVRHGETLGSPIALQIRNRDWENWTLAMSAAPLEGDVDEEDLRPVYLPRPGHADLVGVLKYDRYDARDILERASARETAARVAAGSIAKRLLEEIGVRIGSHIVMLGGIEAKLPDVVPEDLNASSDASPVRCLDPEAEGRMIEAIDDAKRNGDTLGGVFEVVVRGLPIGLGSHVSWDRKLDGRLAGAVMSIQAIKGVEIGMGFESGARPGSRVHDEIVVDDSGYGRAGNAAGGLEGGITTGLPVVVRAAMKPISTLMRPLRTIDIRTGERGDAVRERSDVCALPAAGVVGEAMVAIVLASAVLEKFGGDSLGELRRNFEAYRSYLSTRVSPSS